MGVASAGPVSVMTSKVCVQCQGLDTALADDGCGKAADRDTGTGPRVVQGQAGRQEADDAHAQKSAQTPRRPALQGVSWFQILNAFANFLTVEHCSGVLGG